MRRRIAAGIGLLLMVLAGVACGERSAASAPGASGEWTEWKDFAERFVQADGRIIDWTFEQKSTSEGQSYGLFFALVANDRARFDAILNWTSANLAGGQLGERLPAWHWGINSEGQWGVKDENSAADGEVWIAYTLLEAARLWNAPQYAEIGRKLMATMVEKEIVPIKGGALLLPAPIGFTIGPDRYRFDPSYVPPFVFRYFGTIDPKGPWFQVMDTYIRLSPKMFRHGIAPDLVVVDKDGEVYPDIDRKTAAYDAIRVYMWAALSGQDGVEQLALLRPFTAVIREYGRPPEKIDTDSGKRVPHDWAPTGFAAAALPYLKALGENELAESLRDKVKLERVKSKLAKNSNYYDESLVLFGLGWYEGRYRIDEQGRLLPKWANAPAAKP